MMVKWAIWRANMSVTGRTILLHLIPSKNLPRLKKFQTTNYDFTASPSFIVTIMVRSKVRNNQMWFEIISYELKKIKIVPGRARTCDLPRVRRT